MDDFSKDVKDGHYSAHPGKWDSSDPADCPWLNSYDDCVPRSLNYAKVPLFHWVDETARLAPRTVACQFMNTKMTYAKLQRDAEIIAANLRSFGVKPGDRVGIMLPNLPQVIQAFWGVLKAGAIVVMINPLYMEKELTYQIHDSEISHLITIDLCWPKLEQLRATLGVKHFFITTIADGLGFPLNLLQRFNAWREGSIKNVPFDQRTVLKFSTLLEGKERYSHAIGDPEETLALLQYTGGTTGASKGVMLTHFNLGANIQQTKAALPCLAEVPHHVLIAVVPFFHVYGLTTCILLPTILRSRVVPIPRFSPPELLKAVSKYKGTLLPGAPSVYLSLLQQKNLGKYDLSNLQCCISGSAPMPAAYFPKIKKELGAILIEGYGLTEASPITHLNSALGRQKIGSIGLPFPDTDARIVDMEVGTVPLPPGKVGELILRGPQIMRGYWNRPDDTASTLRNGWLYTGDIAVMDEEGYFTIVDRKKDMVLVGGYNVAPREIDEVLHEHPKIADAVAVGIPHPTRGESIKAYVVLKPGESMEKSEVIAWCRQRLANYKVPRQVEFRDALPKSVVGKILRRMLLSEELEKRDKKKADRLEAGAAQHDDTDSPDGNGL